MKKPIIFTFLIFCSIFTWGQEYTQFFTKEKTVIDTFFHSYLIEDKYRWLEDIDSQETKDWIEQQNSSGKKYLSKAVNNTNSRNSIDRYAFTKYQHPQKMGDYYFTYACYNNISVPALFYQTSLNDYAQILVDPNFISQKDEISLNGYAVSKNSKLLAYQFTRNGSDWNEIKIISLKTGIHKDDHLKGIKFSEISWLGDGFFYSTVSQNGQFGETMGQKVFFHKIGDEQQSDKLIFERKNNPSAIFDYLTTSDERFFVLKEFVGRKGLINFFYIDYEAESPTLQPLLTNLTNYNLEILDSHEGKFIATETSVSNNGSILEIDPANPLKWRAIAPEFSKSLLLNVIPFNDRIVAVYQANQHPVISVLDYSGKVLDNLELPLATSVGGFSGNSYDEELLFEYTSYTIPPNVFKFNIRTFKLEVTKQTTVTFDFENIEYKEVECITKDSVVIPMILVYEKGLKLDGTNPAIIKAYGGFNVVSPPSFDPGIVYFIKQGGVFAFACIRGGGDKGEEWALEGRGKNKQNSYDDFIAASEFLIEHKYTNKGKLASTGGSNGGLVVAVAAIQRPDLYKVVVPVVAPFDMLSLEKFTVGHFNTDEFGTVADSTSFTRLLSYSPYQNIKDTVNYPAMLVVTSENDDRVPPFNSYKFVARMQSRKAQQNPIILKIEANAGHYGASTFGKSIKEVVDVYGFIVNELMGK